MATATATAIPRATPCRTPRGHHAERGDGVYQALRGAGVTCGCGARTPSGCRRPSPARRARRAGSTPGPETISRAATATQTPCSIVEFRPAAPALTFAELPAPRTPATGSPPSSPETTLAAPCPRSSRSRSARGAGAPGPAVRRPTCPRRPPEQRLQAAYQRDGEHGGERGRAPGRRAARPGHVRVPGRQVDPARLGAVERGEPRGAGHGDERGRDLAQLPPARPGIRGHSSSRARVSTLTSSAAGCTFANWAGSARRLSRTELCGVPPRTMCSWATRW